MKLIVDSNVLFTFFWKKSIFSRVVQQKKLKLLTPEIFLEELDKYAEEIIKKTQLDQKEFLERKKELLTNITIVPLEVYKGKLEIITDLESLDEHEKVDIKDDIDFLVLAKKENCPLWSNDKLLKKQKEIPVISTKELIELLN